MDNTLSVARRVLSAIVATLTILWAAGAAAFAVPQMASAATAGDLIRGTSFSTVYFYGYDGSRYVFPNEKTYDSWFNGFSAVETISDSAVAAIPVASSNVVYRPGSRFIKVTTVPDTFAVGRDGMIHWIETEAVAAGLAGSDWNQSIDDVADAFFDNYTEGVSLTDTDVWDGALFMDGADYFIAWNGEKRMLSSAARSANALESRFFLDGASIDDSALDAGDDITGYLCAISDASQSGDCEDEAALTGDVTVSRASSTPAGATVPQGANSLSVFSFNLKAGSEAAEVDLLTLDFEGQAATAGVAGVYLYEGANRLTESRSVNSSTRQVTFGSLNIDLDAGETRTITVRVQLTDSSTYANDEFYFSIVEAESVEGTGTAMGSFPVAGNTFRVGSQSVGDLVITKNGSISDPTVGENDAIIGQFKLEASGEDATVSELTLEIDDAADHSDFQLWANNEIVAVGEDIGDKKVAFVLDDAMLIEDGNSEIFKVSADIGGENGDDVTVSLDNNVDIVATGSDYGFGLSVDSNDANGYDGTSCTTTAGKCSFSDVQGGDVTLAFVGPNAGDIRTDAQSQTLLEFSMTSQENVTVQDLDIIVYGDDDDNDALDGADDATDTDDDGLIQGSGTNVANITDIKIINTETGRVVMGPLELDGVLDADHDGAQTIDFTDDWELEGGETLHLAVVVDIDDAVTSGTEFAATVDMSGLSLEDANGDAVATTDIVPTGDIVGKNQEALAATMTVGLATSPGDITIVKNATNTLVGGFTFQGGDAGSVTVEDVTLAIFADDDNSGTFGYGDVTGITVTDYVSSCSVYNKAGDLLDGPVAPTSSGETLIFTDLDWTIDASENERLDVKCNFTGPSTLYNSNNDHFSFDIIDEDGDTYLDIAASDDDGNDVNITGEAVNDTVAGSETDGTDGVEPSSVVSFTSAGTVATTLDSSSPSADIFLTSTTSNLAAVFRIAATSEDFTVNELTITEEAATDMISADAATYVDNVAQVVLSYTNSEGDVETASAEFGSDNEANFTGLDIFVEEGDHALVSAYVDLNETDRTASGLATSNEYLELGIGSDSGDFNAVASGSGDTDLAANAVTTAARHLIKETKPTIAVNASSPSGVKTPGTIEVYRFNVSAAAGEDVVMKEVLFSIGATDNAGTPSTWENCDTDGADGTFLDDSDFSLYDLSDEGLAAQLEAADTEWSIHTATGALCTTTEADLAYAGITLATPVIISAGTTHTFAFYMNVSGASASEDDSVQVSIPAEWNNGSTFLAASDLNEDNLAIADTTLTVTSSTGYTEGDVVCMDTADNNCGSADEKMLVTAVPDGTTLTVVRGYLGTTPVDATSNDIGDDLDRLPSVFFWEDDGDSSTANDGDEWGAYLVDSLSAMGSGVSF